MINLLYFIVAGVIGYFCGAIPFGFIYVRLFTGKDLRTIGSGRTGGTNSMRAGGKKVGVLTGFSDVFKGVLAIWLTNLLLSNAFGSDLLPWGHALAGTMAVIGHNWSIFLNWGGGAGTGPNVGWATAIWWPMLPVAILVMFLMLVGVGMASVASMTMGLIIPIAFLLLYLTQTGTYDITWAYVVAGVVTELIVLWALRPNIRRLFNGTERVVGPRAKRMQARQDASDT